MVDLVGLEENNSLVGAEVQGEILGVGVAARTQLLAQGVFLDADFLIGPQRVQQLPRAVGAARLHHDHLVAVGQHGGHGLQDRIAAGEGVEHEGGGGDFHLCALSSK